MANAVVTYVLNVQGNFNAKIDDAKKKVVDFGKSLSQTGKELQRSSLISDFEQMTSLLIPMGGGLSKVGMLAATAARPLATLGAVVGTANLATVAMTGGLALLGIGLLKTVTSTKAWVGEMVKVRKELVQQGYLSSGAALNLVEYEKAVTRLSVSTERLKVSTADSLAPAFQELVDAGTGVMKTFNDMQDGAEAVKVKISALIGSFGLLNNNITATAIGAALSYFAEEGAEPIAPGLPPGAARGLLTPMAKPKGAGFVGGKFTSAEQMNAQRDALGTATQAAYAEMQEALKDLNKSLDSVKGEIPGFLTRLGIEAQRVDNALREIADPDSAFQHSIDKMVGMWEGAINQSQQVSMEGGLAGVVSSATAGAVNLGPITMVVDLFNGLVEELFSLPDLMGTVLDNVLKVYLDLPSLVGNITSQFIPELIRAAPEIAGGFASVGPAIVFELVKSAPLILSTLIETLIGFPRQFIDQFADAFDIEGLIEILKGIAAIWENPGETAKRLLGVDFSSDKKTLFGVQLPDFGDGISLKGNNKQIFGYNVPSFDTGGMVERTGLAYVHAGERVLNRTETRTYNGGSVGTINVFGATDARRLAEEFRRKLGPYGHGLSLAPYVGG